MESRRNLALLEHNNNNENMNEENSRVERLSLSIKAKMRFVSNLERWSKILLPILYLLFLALFFPLAIPPVGEFSPPSDRIHQPVEMIDVLL